MHLITRSFVALAFIMSGNVFAAEAKAETQAEKPAKEVVKKEEKKVSSSVKFTTNHGDFVIELNNEKAPKTVANFLSYVEDGFYDGTVFHRVIENFMIQGGGFTPDMAQKETKDKIENEANNGLKNDVGTVAMARTRDPHSATAQFFINVRDNDFLNFTSESMQGWGYAVFGKVTEGMEVVRKIEQIKTGRSGMHQDVPVEAVVIEKATVIGE